MAEAAIKYRAFLSYSHRDKAWGKWLHSALEEYRIDKDLIERQTSVGPVPKTLRPIFRDREDFSAGHSLTAQTLAALEASQFLIVLCSPHAARSEYVNEEIRRFKALGRADRVIPVIIDGEPGDPERECFPRTLRYKLAAHGALTPQREEPIAADARSVGDGREIAKQKVVAGLLGLGLDEIVRRAERARKKRHRFWTALTAAIFLFAVAATGSAYYNWRQAEDREAFLDSTLKSATDIVDAAVAQAEQYGVPRTATIELLNKAEGLFEIIARFGSETPKVLARKAWMLIQFGRNYAVLGQSSDQRQRVTAALQIMKGLSKEHPNNVDLRGAFGETLYEMGKVEFVQGQFDKAIEFYQEALLIITPLAPSANALAELHTVIGEASRGRGDFAAALEAYAKALVIVDRSALQESASAHQLARAALHAKRGDVFLIQFDISNALSSFKNSLELLHELTVAKPKDLEAQNLYAVVHGRIGFLMKIQGNFDEALIAFRKQQSIIEGLVSADPKNALWQFNLSAAHYSVGLVLVELSNLDEALSAYETSLKIRERLVSADPKNVNWLLGLMGTWSQIGFVHRIEGRASDALVAYVAAKDIAERLIAIAPSSPDYRIGFGGALESVAETLEYLQRPNDALATYKASIKSAETLVASYSENTSYRMTLSTTRLMVGNLLLHQEDFSAALDSYIEAVRLVESANRDFNTAQPRPASVGIREYLSLTSEVYEGSRHLARTLSYNDPISARWLASLANAYSINADKFASHGYFENALEVSKAALEIRKGLALAAPTSVTYQRDLSMANEKVGQIERQINQRTIPGHNWSQPFNGFRSPHGFNWPASPLKP